MKLARLSSFSLLAASAGQRVLLALTQALPVELHYLTRYWVTLRPRAAKK